MPLSIRSYELADLDALVALFRGTVRRVARRDYIQAQVLAWAPDDIDLGRWASRLATHRVWVADLDGAIIGFIALEPGDGHVDQLYVHAEYQRRRAGHTLLATAEAFARAHSLSRLYTEASITARPFFEASGFVVRRARTVTLRGQEFVNYRMEKSLLPGPPAVSPSLVEGAEVTRWIGSNDGRA